MTTYEIPQSCESSSRSSGRSMYRVARQAPFHEHSAPKGWYRPRLFQCPPQRSSRRPPYSCDVCQKSKFSNFNKFGLLIPNPIPSRPYQSISMDFLVNLPWSDGYNAIYVVVDRLTKHASFIPTTTGLDVEGFAHLFVRNVVCRFGLPESIITDRDPRWTADFWLGIAKVLQTRMSLSLSHHPQHDGQTEVVNRLLTTMLRAFTSGKKSDWSKWLHLLEFAYNSAVHSSTSATPFHLLLGFNPRTLLDFIGTKRNDDVRVQLRLLSCNPKV